VHATLKRVFDHSVAHFQADTRVLGAWVYGSANVSSEDAFSDVDPVFLIRDEDFEAIDAELRGLFETWCGRVSLWWPETFNCPTVRNYAILFPAPSSAQLLQYDVNIMSVSGLRDNAFCRCLLAGCLPEQVLFDKTGIIASTLRELPAPEFSSQGLRLKIDTYWLYAFINTKYLSRGDVWKSSYVRGVMFQNHLDILFAKYRQTNSGWWAINIKKLPKDEQKKLMNYLGAMDDLSGLKTAFLDQVTTFSQDAKLACEACRVAYPADVERDIMAHIEKAVGNRL